MSSEFRDRTPPSGIDVAGQSELSDAASLIHLAKPLIAERRYADAERVLSIACEAFSDHAQAWSLSATCLWNIGRYESAVEAAGRALKLAPSAENAAQKGWMDLKLGRLDDAEAVLSEAITHFPDSGSMPHLLTQVYKVGERWADGAAAAERACHADPTDFDMRESWAACLIAAGRPAAALGVIADGLLVFSEPAEHYQLLMRRAEAYQQLHDAARAIEAFAAALELQPSDEIALEKISALTASANRADQMAYYRGRLLAVC